MIPEAEIRRKAAVARVDPMVLDLDYSLGWFLAGLSSLPDLSNRLVFKGGTCLRKCYFDGYRFSEDLDFTAVAFVQPKLLRGWVEQVGNWSAERDGPNFAIEPIQVEINEDEYGKESFQVRVYYRGPLVWGGSPRVIRMDVTRDEKVLLPPAGRHLLHAYSDAEALGAATLNCYTLVEILSEKLRAIAGQRRFAVSRDLYDIYHLIQAGISFEDVLPLVLVKFKGRGMDVSSIDPEQFLVRKPEFERDWQRRLSYLVSGQKPVSFDEAWQTSIKLLKTLKKSYPASTDSHQQDR
jgi:predicted nucleotidyltransferase component of viral defense system